MVLLSFSVKEDELLAGTKTRATRLYTEAKWEQWKATVPPNATKMLDLWWKSRTPNGYLIDSRPGADLYCLVFHYLNGHYWPCKERKWLAGYTPMTTDEFKRYIKEEGFEGHPDELLSFFTDHYAPLEGKVFQSIAFPVPRMASP